MRRSVLSRSALSLAALGLTTAALAAPTTAAGSTGVTRDMVITAAQGLRTTEPTQAQQDALSAIIRLHCGFEPAPDDTTWPSAAYVSGGVDGLLVSTQSHGTTYRHCIFAALTTVDPAAQLDGTVTITHQPITTKPDPEVTTLVTEPLSGGVVLATPVSGYYGDIRMQASGGTTTTVTDRTTTEVREPKTRAQKRAAKKTYVKRLKAARKTYANAVDRAGRSSTRKAAARTTYVRSRAAARARYTRAISEQRLVVRTSTRPETRPFSAIAQAYSLIRFG